jgi:hypothetical protein
MATKVNDEGLSIIKASYGIQGNFVDVTKEVQGLIKDGELDFVVSAQSLGILDPAPGVQKDLQVQYTINGGNKNLDTISDTKQLKLSVPSVKHNVNHTFSFMKYLWTSIVIFFVGVLAIDSYKAGHYVFGKEVTKTLADGTVLTTKENYVAAVLLSILAIFTFGHFYFLAAIPLVLAIGWWYR